MPPAADPAPTLPPVQQAPAPAPAPELTPPPPPAEEAPAEEAPAAEEPESHWYDDFSIGGFVDAYGAIRSDSNRKRAAPDDSPVSGPVGYGHEAYVQADGFALAFAGLDLAYSGEKFGATVSLRFGPGVNRFYVADMGSFGIDNLTQAYVTWKPTDWLTFDLGQFGTIYGAEVSESWRNINYSRGALFYAMQPFWHTGLRANVKLSDSFQLNGLLVNGVNTPFEGNKSPSLGIQGVLTPTDSLSFALGYFGALNPHDGDEETLATANFQNFFDFVGTLQLDHFKLVANVDYNLYKPAGADDSENWFGFSIAPAVAFNDYFGIGARVEWLSDSANSQLLMPNYGVDAEEQPYLSKKTSLTTLTATLDIKPVPGSAALVLRPEFRYEIASNDNYLDGDGDPTKNFWSVHLGAVVTSLE